MCPSLEFEAAAVEEVPGAKAQVRVEGGRGGVQLVTHHRMPHKGEVAANLMPATLTGRVGGWGNDK